MKEASRLNPERCFNGNPLSPCKSTSTSASPERASQPDPRSAPFPVTDSVRASPASQQQQQGGVGRPRLRHRDTVHHLVCGVPVCTCAPDIYRSLLFSFFFFFVELRFSFNGDGGYRLGLFNLMETSVWSHRGEVGLRTHSSQGELVTVEGD